MRVTILLCNEGHLEFAINFVLNWYADSRKYHRQKKHYRKALAHHVFVRKLRLVHWETTCGQGQGLVLRTAFRDGWLCSVRF